MRIAARALLRPAAITLLSAATAALLAACGGAPSGPERTTTVTMRDIAFEPGAVDARTGERLRLTFRNQGAITHDFTVEQMPLTAKSATGGASSAEHAHNADRFALHLALAAGKAGELRFTPSKAGEYTFYCTVAGHLEAGMRGTLRVQ